MNKDLEIPRIEIFKCKKGTGKIVQYRQRPKKYTINGINVDRAAFDSWLQYMEPYFIKEIMNQDTELDISAL